MDTTVEVGTSSDSNIRLVAPGALPFVWNKVVELMRQHPRGLLDGWTTEDEVLGRVTMNNYDLWVALDPADETSYDAVFLCQLEKYAAFSIYRIVWGGGRVAPHLSDLNSQLSFYATSVLDANTLALDGRTAWIRALAKYGFEPAKVTLYKPLGGRH